MITILFVLLSVEFDSCNEVLVLHYGKFAFFNLSLIYPLKRILTSNMFLIRKQTHLKEIAWKEVSRQFLFIHFFSKGKFIFLP